MVSGKDVTSIEQTLSKELESIHEWLTENKLSLHLGKTESILFGSKRRLNKKKNMKVTCNGSGIESKTNVTYLGITLDQSITGENIASKVISKSTNKLKFLYRNTTSFDLQTKKLLVSALIQCHFDYACSSWYSGLSQKLKNKIQITQNKIIRYLLNAPARTHIGFDEFKKVRLLPVASRVEQLKLNHMYGIVNGKAPEYLCKQVQMVSEQHSHQTRGSSLACVVPRVNSFGITSFMYTGIKIWNNLPISLKKVKSKQLFKQEIKKYLFNKSKVQNENVFHYY